MTTTRTHTYTLEEAAVLNAMDRTKAPKTMEEICERIHAVAESDHTPTPDNPQFVNVSDWLTPVLVGQLIERGLVFRTGTEPERYRRA